MKKLFCAALLATLMVPSAWGASDFPKTYDLREYGVVPAEVRDQNPWGLCWAFGILAAVESNYLVNVSNDRFTAPGLGTTSADVHTSELHLGYFLTKAPKGREYMVFSVTSGDNDLIPVEKLGTSGLTGANWIKGTAFLSRGYGFGPIKYDTLPYVTDKSGAGLPATDAKPEGYAPSVLRLEEAWHTLYPRSSDKNFESERQAIINDVKGLIMKHGALYYRYVDADDSRNETYKTYFCSENDLARVKPSAKAGHIVAVVGWDDDFPKESFDVKDREKPTIDGAWLIRNSWGTENKDHDNGYFWASYEQQAEFAAFLVTSADKNLARYDWDDLGWCSEWGDADKASWAVNVFKTGSQPVTLSQIGFYTVLSNTSVDIAVNTRYGTTKPTKDTVSMGSDYNYADKFGYAGYHTVYLNNPITIPANSYFSVGMKATRDEIAVETKLKGYSDYARVFDGQSFFSLDGQSWTDGTQIVQKNAVTPMNACIKAFVTAASGHEQPEETEEEMTIGGKKVMLRPESTVSDGALMDANNPNDRAVLTGRKLTVFLLSGDSQPLPTGTKATLTFLFCGSDADYNKYYNGEGEDEKHDYGYDERPGSDYLRLMYPEGFEPHAYVEDTGELYAAYTQSPEYEVTVGEDGKVELNVGSLPTATSGRSLPAGYYDVYYTVASTSAVGTLPILNVTPAPGNDSSSGCSAGLGGCLTLGLAGLILSLKRR